MRQRAGDVTGNEVWMRCVFCGDSRRDLTKCHMSVNLKTGLYHCYRCHAGGKLKTSQLFTLIMKLGVETAFAEDVSDLERDTELPLLTVGAGNYRPSYLDRYHWLDSQGQIWDAFQIRDVVDDGVTGVYLRNGKTSRICGGSGFGWAGPRLPTSTPTQPLRIVEGPYDVLGPRDLCTFGLVTWGLKDLRGHYVILTPDGDIWQKPDLFRQFTKQVYSYIWGKRTGPYILGIEIIPEGLDPDECPVDQREFLPQEVLTRSQLANRTARKKLVLEELLS